MPKPLSLDEVNQLATLIGTAPAEQTRQRTQRMERDQPIVYAYLAGLGSMARSGGRLSPEAVNTVRTLGVVVWAVLEAAGRPPAPVSLEWLGQTGDALVASLHGRASLPPKEQRARVARDIANHPEPGLLAYVTLALQQKTDPPLDDDSLAQSFFHLRVILDSLVTSPHPAPRRARRRSRRPAG